jgi:hypothetical protein
MKLILSNEGKVICNYDYVGEEQPDIIFYNKVFYVKFGEFIYRPASAYIDSKDHLININGDILTTKK